MSSVNRVILLGRLGQDPEVKTIDSGTKLANFSIATDKKWNDSSGNKQQKTTWHNCVVFGKLADVVEKYLTKGSQVYLEGEISVDSYEKNGEKRTATKIIVNSLTMLGGRDQESTPKSNPKPNAFTGGGYQDDQEDKLPF